MQENQPKDNGLEEYTVKDAENTFKMRETILGPVHPEAKKIIERVLNNEPLRNDRPVEYELSVRCEDGFTFTLQKGALRKIVKEGLLEERIRRYRDFADEQARMMKNLAEKNEKHVNVGTSREQI